MIHGSLFITTAQTCLLHLICSHGHKKRLFLRGILSKAVRNGKSRKQISCFLTFRCSCSHFISVAFQRKEVTGYVKTLAVELWVLMLILQGSLWINLRKHKGEKICQIK